MVTTNTGVPLVRTADWLRDGWNIFASDVAMFIFGGLIFGILSGLCFPILFGPLACGMYLMVFDRMRGDRVEVGRIFSGFDYFGHSLAAGLILVVLWFVGLIVVLIGFVLAVIPALIGVALWVLIHTIFLFVFQLIIDRGMSATEAISVSYNKIKENFWEFLLFGLVLWLITAAGSSVAFGFIVTAPLTFAASAAAYRDVFGFAGEAGTMQAP